MRTHRPDRLSVLCVHGIGHGDADASLVPSWTDAITQVVHRWQPGCAVDLEFLRYDDLFDHAPLDLAVYGRALAEILASGAVHGIGDFLGGARGLHDLPDQVRWTAGMIAQWATEDGLRDGLRRRLLQAMRDREPDLVCAHSLGSLIAYDTFRRNPGVLAGKTLLTFGSQIGNPFVRDAFAGRIEPLDARAWYHLFNPADRVFTSRLRIEAPNFVEVLTEFDKPNDVINHDPVCYMSHPDAQARVWAEIAGGGPPRSVARAFRAMQGFAKRPDRRALLVGINAYPDPANRLEGCVNDVFLMSSVLQECGFGPEEIRVVLDERATAQGILERLHWLLDDVDGGAERVLFYSGHGAQIPSYDVRGEVDHLDECLVPYDFDWTPARAIRDKQFVEFYSQLPYDARFVAIFDCCHSGGMNREGGARPRGIEPPDDIRHRALEWDLTLQMWRERKLRPQNPTLAGSKVGSAYLGRRGVTHRFGRGMALRSLPSSTYDRERKRLRHRGAYLPVILEACQEAELSYEYRDGATSYGAFTYCLAKVLRIVRGQGQNPTFRELTERTAGRLRALDYRQTPALVGARPLLDEAIPWSRRPRPRRARRGGTDR
ncbi:MAG: caspase family protein [Acidobacteriia bacterium]|nr:caspase family protein [Terriglobia bacterium]